LLINFFKHIGALNNMSFIHLFIIKDDQLYSSFVHYRTIQKLLESNLHAALPLMKSSFLDAGYVVFDLNKNVVVNGQVASRFDVLRKKDLFVIEA